MAQEPPVFLDPAQTRRQLLIQFFRFPGLVAMRRKPGFQDCDFGVALEYFEAGIHQRNTVENCLQFGRLVHDMNRRGDFSAIMQQAGDLQFVAILVRHFETAQRAFFDVAGRFGQHHGQRRNALAVSAGVGGLVVDRRVNQSNERLEQLLELIDQKAVRECHGGLGCQGFGEPLVGFGKRHGYAGLAVPGVDQLQHADDLVLVVLHRYGQKRLRAIPGLAVEVLGATEIETVRRIGVDYVDGLGMQDAIRNNHRVVWATLLVMEPHRIERHLYSGGAAHGNVQGVGAQDFEMNNFLLRIDAIERPAVGIGDLFCRHQNGLEQAGSILDL